jgi:hypothetical protein
MIVTVKEQTTQWPKEKAQKDKQRSTKHTNKNKDRVTRPHRKDREVCTTSGTYPWSFVTQIFYNGQPSHGGEVDTLGLTVHSNCDEVVDTIVIHGPQ